MRSAFWLGSCSCRTRWLHSDLSTELTWRHGTCEYCFAVGKEEHTSERLNETIGFSTPWAFTTKPERPAAELHCPEPCSSVLSSTCAATWILPQAAQWNRSFALQVTCFAKPCTKCTNQVLLQWQQKWQHLENKNKTKSLRNFRTAVSDSSAPLQLVLKHYK